MRRGTWISMVAFLVLATGVVTAAADPSGPGPTNERADVMVQGGGDALVDDGALLRRRHKAVAIKVKMPTPEPGTYAYPEGAVEGDLEVFTLWAFVFNNPEECGDDGCNGADIGGPANVAVYHADGRVGWDSQLVFMDRIKVGQEQFAGTHALENPLTAEIHVAVAPHGAADETILRTQLTTPRGDPSFPSAALFK